MRHCFFLFLLILFCGESISQRKGLLSKEKQIACIGFQQLDGGVPLIVCRLSGIDDTLRFILDSGSGGVSLDSAFCAQHQFIPAAADSNISGIGGTVGVDYLFEKSLIIGSYKTRPMNFHIYDYSQLSAVYGEKIDGVLGFPFISQFLIYIDNDLLQMEFYPPQKIKYPKNGQLLHPRIALLPLQHLTIRDKKISKMNFFLDCGAGLPVLFNESYLGDSAILRDHKKYFYTRAAGTGGNKQMRITTVREIILGKYHFSDVPAYIFKDENNVTAYPFSGGLLGNEILRRFNIVLNYAHSEIHITPNTHFQDGFDYGYSGLTLHQYDNKIIVEDVVPESPAAKAGMVVGDELVGVDQYFSGSLKFFRNLLQQPDKEFKVFVTRKNVLMQLLLKTESIK
jgi:hypothetical protein